MSVAEIGGLYEHYKKKPDNVYKVIAIARYVHAEDIEIVVYKNVGTNEVWARERKEFEEPVQRVGGDLERFTRLKEASM